jgi:hypothetical protein
MDQPEPPPPARKRVAVAAALLVLIAFYTWTALPQVTGLNVPNPPPGNPGHYPLTGQRELYNALAEALLAGKTSLFIRPRPELLALDDPYDPIKNHQVDARGLYCLHDASLYRGKYYVYFGVAPAVLLFAPYLLVTGHYLPTAVAALVFAVGGLVWSALLLNLLTDRFYPGLGAAMRFLLVLALGCCSCVPFLLRSPLVYEVAILGAYACVAGGLYFLARGTWGLAVRRWSIAVGSLLLGLAVGCRPHMGLIALLVFVVAFVWIGMLIRQGTLAWRQISALALALTGPWLVVVLVLGAYNYHRFQSFTEFGARYNLVGNTVRVVDLPVLDWHRLAVDLYCYLLFPPGLQSRFPYMHLREPNASLLPAGHFGVTPIAGVLIGMPFLGLLALAPWTLVRAWKQRKVALVAALTVLVGGGLSELICVACFGGAMRYTVDFANLLVLAAFLLSFDLALQCRQHALMRRTLRVLFAVSVTLGCLFNLGISIEGQRSLCRDVAVRDQLRRHCPRLRFLDKPATSARSRCIQDCSARRSGA